MKKKTHQPWTEQEIDVLKSVYATTSNADIAAKLGRGIASVTWKANSLNLSKTNLWNTRELGQLRAMYPVFDVTDIAVVLGRKVTTVQSMAWRLKLTKSAPAEISAA